MTGRIDSANAIGKCDVEIIGRNQVSIDLKGFKGEEFGTIVEFLPDPRIAEAGGVLSADWGWAPMSLEISSENSAILEFERKANPFRVSIPKRTAGFDPRKIRISAIWNAELIEKLRDLGREWFSFSIISEFSDEEEGIVPILFNYGRGMRSDGLPSLVSNAITHNSQLYTPISPLKDISSHHFRSYPDGSIHIDKMGPYFFTKSNDVSVTGPLLNFSRIDVEKWEGVKRGEDDLLYAESEVGGKKVSGVSHQACFFELLGIISKTVEDGGSRSSDKVANIVGHMVESMDDSGLWKHDYPIEILDVEIGPGWSSCLTQALGAMGLVRAGEYLGEPSLKANAERAILGVLESEHLFTEVNGLKIYGEHSSGLPSCVLSTHLYVLMAISDIVEVRGTKKWRGILKKIEESTIKILPFYDLANSTSYDLSHIFHNKPPNKASPQYHSTHVMQLEWLDGKLESSEISEFAERWANYLY